MARGDAAEGSGRGESRAVRIVHSLAAGPAAQRRRRTPVGLAVFGASLAVVVFGGLATDRLPSIPTLPVLVALVGTGLLLRSTSMVLLWTPAYLLLHVLELKRVEEPELERRFGVAYRAYRQAVPMWLPLPGRAAVRRLPPAWALAGAASAVAGRLSFQRRYVGAAVVAEEGRAFRVFRHLALESGAPAPESPALLIVRFRFARLSERWNRRLSLIPVPAIGGYPGFRAKVWMSDAEDWWQDGYERQSSEAARQYRASFVFRTMERRAGPGTVAMEILESRRLTEWMMDQAHTTKGERGARVEARRARNNPGRTS